VAEGTAAQNAIVAFRCGERVRALSACFRPRFITILARGAARIFAHRNYFLVVVAVERIERIVHRPVSSWLAAQWLAAVDNHAPFEPACRDAYLPAPLRLKPEDAIMLAAMVAGTALISLILLGLALNVRALSYACGLGFHLAIVAGFIFFISRKLRIHRVPATFLTILISFAYALFTGFATPVQRSLWM